MFLGNARWIGGGLHQNDAAVLAPIFHDGKLFGWTMAIAHQVDLGGPRPGSLSPSAHDGTWSAVGYQEQSQTGDRGLHAIKVAMAGRRRVRRPAAGRLRRRPPRRRGRFRKARRLDDNLVVLDSGTVVCVHCGTEVGPLEGGAFVAGLARRDAAPTEAGPHIWHDPLEYVDAEIVFRQLLCPGCLTAVHSRVVPVDHPVPVDDYRSWSDGITGS